MFVDAVRNRSRSTGQAFGNEYERVLAPEGRRKPFDYGLADDIDRINRIALVIAIDQGERVDGLLLCRRHDRIANPAME